MKTCIWKTRGFSLLEMLLVLAISSSLIILLLNYTTQKSDEMRRDRTALQMQQILDAALTYYVNNSAWPVTCGTATWRTLSLANTPNLVPNYIPNMTNMNNPYGNVFSVNC